MTIVNCRNCGRIFNKIRRDLCPSCIQEEEKAFERIRNYLRQHRDASMAEVTEATEVPAETIVELIRDGRLILRDSPNLTYPCERCGSPTQAGRYCAKCTQELTTSLNAARNQLQEKAQEDKGNKGGYYSRG